MILMHLCIPADLSAHVYSFVYRADNVDKDQQPTLVEELKLELSQKNMIFSKKSLHLSKIVGQGMYNPQTKGRSSGF